MTINVTRCELIVHDVFLNGLTWPLLEKRFVTNANRLKDEMKAFFMLFYDKKHEETFESTIQKNQERFDRIQSGIQSSEIDNDEDCINKVIKLSER